MFGPFWGFKILNFNIYIIYIFLFIFFFFLGGGGGQKNEYFLGYEDLVDIFGGSSQNWTVNFFIFYFIFFFGGGGHFYAF